MPPEEDVEQDSLEKVIRDMARHAEENPSHGYNCACKDAMLRRGRKILMEMDGTVRQEFYYLADILTRY